MPKTTDYKPKLLILEDDPVSLALFEKTTMKMGLFSRIVPCSGSREAVEALRNGRFDLLLLDYAVDELTGLDVFNEARKLQNEIAAILVTAYDEKPIIISAIKAGVRDFLEKPVQPQILANSLTRAWEELETRILLDIESRNHLELLENLPDIVYKIDLDGHIQYINKTVEELGYLQSELWGKHITEIISNEDFQSHSLQSVLEAYRNRTGRNRPSPKLINERRTGARRTQNLKIRLLSRNASEGTVFRNGQLVSFGEISARGLAEGSAVTGSVGIIRDITEREKERNALKEALKRLQQSEVELQKANNAKNQFMANMSHEIRTPLNGIMGMVDLLRESGLTEEQHKRLDVINTSCRTLRSIIDDILDLSRIEADRLKLAVAPFSPEDILAETIYVAQGLPDAAGLDIRRQVTPDAPPVLLGDAERIKQIMLNLLSNAVKYTEEGSVAVELNWEPAEAPNSHRLQFSVRDTGIGIPEDKMNIIFERFEQADGSDTRRYGGAGLGLAISRKLARMMGGDIEAKSQPGAGSDFRFSVTLPEAESEPSPAEPSTTVPFSGPMLIVEDNASNLAVICGLLEKMGIETDAAKNGAEALEKAAERPYDVIFMDLQMPLMDGMEATRKIRESGGPNADTFIVALTAHVIGDVADRCRETGMDAYLPKPAGRKEILRMLQLLNEQA